MNIISIEFLLFALVILILYYLIPPRAQKYLLLAASYLFLVSWSWQFALVFLVLTLINYWAALVIARKNKRSKFALVAGIIINILALAFFKYANFFIPAALHLMDKVGLQTGSAGINILLPIGLSFFVVQVISYLIDIRKGISAPATNLMDFGLYMAYFPRVVSGPIERSRVFLA